MSLHSDTLVCLRANPYLSLLLNAACLAEKQPIGNTNFIDFGLPQPGLEHTIYRILGEHDDHYTIDVVPNIYDNIT
jgi:hypothetical protein